MKINFIVHKDLKKNSRSQCPKTETLTQSSILKNGIFLGKNFCLMDQKWFFEKKKRDRKQATSHLKSFC